MAKPGFCSKCGGELDSEGWCQNYCMDSDPELILMPDGSYATYEELKREEG